MKKRLTIILIIISVIIIVVGIQVGNESTNELTNSANYNNIYVDGTDFSKIAEVGATIGSKILGGLVILFSILAVSVIWLIYGIVLIVISIVKRIKSKRKEE